MPNYNYKPQRTANIGEQQISPNINSPNAIDYVNQIYDDIGATVVRSGDVGVV
jgi:hypothetical protein